MPGCTGILPPGVREREVQTIGYARRKSASRTSNFFTKALALQDYVNTINEGWLYSDFKIVVIEPFLSDYPKIIQGQRDAHSRFKLLEKRE